MGSKKARQSRIRGLLLEEAIGTHERLAAALARLGIEVSQSTLSKDLREVGVVRVPCADGGFRYMAPDTGNTLHDRRILERELRDYLVGVQQAHNLLVLHTVSGHAQSVCESLDRIGWSESLGTVAGENTIFVATAGPEDAKSLQGRIADFIGEAA
jgi:transcriptional regulator of arginine metabolism